jgi:hypothetical protein
MKISWIIGSSLFVVVAGAWLVHCRPSRVWVTFVNIPRGTCFTSVVVEKNGVILNLNWYNNTELMVPMTSHPGQDSRSEMPGDRGQDATTETSGQGICPPDVVPASEHPIEWVCGNRYGVVTKTLGDVWEITWFRPNQATPYRSSRHFGGKTVALDLTKGIRERMSPFQVNDLLDKHLGLVWKPGSGTMPSRSEQRGN